MEVIETDTSLNVVANKTFVVTMIQSDPYVMLKQDVRRIAIFCRIKNNYLYKLIYANYFNVFLILLGFQMKQLRGNERFEGYAVELMTGIAEVLNFTIIFKLVDDDKVFSIQPLYSLYIFMYI